MTVARRSSLRSRSVGLRRPEEIATAVPWLCSDEAAFTVGHARVLDGAQTA
jgi:NAD(P)-dependent dehydrogenase (short-subunit alcohol dehydrogenase family)